ncbi:MAG: DUF1697 domain-containing protein [Bacteroidetes bacterium]|nr:DUF1697 domain-containing protein [Bacteroidota bacterium]HET6244433.1 DUF1697 domain-containing protein [Bacteroidia bacterium]
MQENQYIALLRGINVGGNNIIKMVDLKACFEKLGFTQVTTYIQSGNVFFISEEKEKSILANKIETVLSETFNYKSQLVLISQKQIEAVIKEAPKGFGSKSDEFKYDVLFLKDSLSSSEAMEKVNVREGIDESYQGTNVLYFSRITSKAGQSYLDKLISNPVYKSMTIRNWNTTSKLDLIMKERVEGPKK